MNFGELQFWIILGSGLGLILGLRGLLSLRRQADLVRFDKVSLASLGLCMLGAVSWESLVIYVLVVLTTYWGLVLITRRGGGSSRWLWILIPLQLAPLLYYKYSRFIAVEILGQRWSALEGLVIPIGISFYTFQKVAFAVDTLVARKSIPRFLDYLNFVAFFPQLVAGPIERRENLLPQIERFRFRWSAENLDEGVGWVVLGLFFKCCLADNLATFFDPSVAGEPLAIWRQNLLFGFRIYYDFSGYSLIAVGLGKCLGVNLTFNFQSPYCSTSPVEFWRRWHITLSQWFRDYIYIPMGAGRVPWWAFNVLVVFTVSGVWHGAGWNFLIWGLLHAALLVANRLMPKRRYPGWVGWGVTFLLVTYTWLCFYETRPKILAQKMLTIANPAHYSRSGFLAAAASLKDPNVYVSACFLALGAATLLLEWISLRRGKEAYHYLRGRRIMLALIILTVWLAPGKTNEFIYFAF